MNAKENLLRAIRFETPETIPIQCSINPACWDYYPHEVLCELMASHPILFPDYINKDSSEPVTVEYGLNARADESYTDPWGCVWQTTTNGITGTVTQHPLADWEAFEGYSPPDPDKFTCLDPIDWEAVGKSFRDAKAKDRLTVGWLRHGHTFLKLCDIRGYENLIFDMADADPRLDKLIGMIEEFNLATVERYIALGAEYIAYPEDLGMQVGPMLSPEYFRKYIKPVYERIIAPAREAGCIIHMHSDGDIRTLADDLIDGGVEVLNLQDLVNGIDWIKDNLTGRICIDLDIDRQNVTRFGTPKEIDALICHEVEKLSCKEGGLSMIHGLFPGVPLENVKAVMDSMEKYSAFYS